MNNTKKKERKYKNKQWLEQQYIVNNLGTVEIGDMCNCSCETIRCWLHKHGIPVRKQGEKISDMSIVIKKMWKKPENRRKHVEARIRSWNNNTERRRKCSEQSKKKWETPEIRKKMIKGMKEKFKDPEFMKEHKERIHASNEKRIKLMRNRYENKEERERISRLTKKAMNRPEVKKKMKEEGRRRKGKNIEDLGHNVKVCNCPFCKQKRGDISWYTEDVKNRKIQTLRKRMKDNPEKWSKVYKKAGRNSFKSNKKKSPYIWKGASFMSSLERECAKVLLSEPVDGYNCNVEVNGKFIDFFPQKGDKMFVGSFVEYHPWDSSGLTTEEYYEQRRKAIQESQYQDANLFVITDLSSIKDNVNM